MARKQSNSTTAKEQARKVAQAEKQRAKERAKLLAYREHRKETRHNISKLKRAGLVSRDIDARSLQPSKRFDNLQKKYAHVIEGKEKTFKVPKAKIKELKEQGYTVVKDRVILSSDLIARQGNVFQAPAKRAGASAHKREVIKLGMNAPTQVRHAFSSLKDGDYIGFNIYGNNSIDIYQDADAMLAKLYEYRSVQKGQVAYITIFRTNKPHEYLEQRRAQKVETDRAAVERKNARRKAFRKGLRVSRGH